MSRSRLSSAPRVDHDTLTAAITVGGGPLSRAERRRAWGRIIAQVHRVVVAVLGATSPEVDDAAQDAFEHVCRGIPGFRFDPERPSGASAWVNLIAQRAAVDRRRVDHDTVRDAPGEPAGEGGGDPTSAIDRARLAAALLLLLDERHRAVLRLRHWSDSTDEEIAATLGIPLGTVKTRARKARLELARAYREDPEIRRLIIGTLG